MSQAESCLQQGLALSQEIGDEDGRATILCNLGLVVRDQGELDAAEQLLTDGLTVFQKGDNKYGISFFLSHLSTVSLQAGRLDAEQRQIAALIPADYSRRIGLSAQMNFDAC